jgi:hypothetical protein
VHAFAVGIVLLCNCTHANTRVAFLRWITAGWRPASVLLPILRVSTRASSSLSLTDEGWRVPEKRPRKASATAKIPSWRPMRPAAAPESRGGGAGLNFQRDPFRIRRQWLRCRSRRRFRDPSHLVHVRELVTTPLYRIMDLFVVGTNEWRIAA